MKLSFVKEPNLKSILIIVAVIFATVICVDAFTSQKNREIGDDEWEEVEEDSSESSSYVEEEVSTSKGKDSKYDLKLELNVEDMTVDGVLNFTYYNDEEVEMDSLVFYLYANSFEKAEYEAISLDEHDLAYPNGFSEGKIEIESVQIEGGGTYAVEGEQDHILVVSLSESVQPKKQIDLKIEYTVTIPNCLGRFGYGENTISVVNCNPILSVYEDEFYDYKYYAMGDPFYSECDDYTAEITVPEDYQIAVTGHVKKTIEADNKITYNVDGSDRRDFGFVASDKFEVITKEVNGVTISSYSFDGGTINERALEAGAQAIDIFSSLYGEYPYKDFNVVEADFYIGGMEYPGMVLIDQTYYNILYESIMEMIIAHETAHQWWYAQVGSDQVTEPWLDEALTDFSTRMYYEMRYPENYEYLIQQNVDSSYEYLNNYVDEQTSEIDSPVWEFDSSELYSLVVYGEGSWMFADLREELGDEVFFKAMKNYLKENRFGIATREDLEKAIEEVCGYDITQWFDEKFTVQVGN